MPAAAAPGCPSSTRSAHSAAARGCTPATRGTGWTWRQCWAGWTRRYWCTLLAEGRLRTEQFAAKPVELWPSAAGPAAGLPGEPADEAFEVELASTGEVIAVPAGQSALDALEAAGANVMWSCREGTCGTCETGVTAGRIDHRDAILTEDERAVHDVFFPCVSRAASGCPRLTLDL
jgi:ferredoxin